MKQNKCFVCSMKKNHHFVDCISANCFCPCIDEIYQMYKNNRQDEIKPVHPKFLKIDNEEVKELPNQDKDIKEFVKIKKSEWVKKKRDKRLKRKKK